MGIKSITYVLLVLTLALNADCYSQDAIRWAPDLESARKASAEYKVPLLVHFYGDNCLPCKTLEARVLSKSEITSVLNKYFICVRVNATQNRPVAAEFGVHSWPTDVFLSPDGHLLYQNVCPQDPEGYISTLENIAVMNRDRNATIAANKPQQSNAAIAQQVSAPSNLTGFAPNLPAPGSADSNMAQQPAYYASNNPNSQQQLAASQPPQNSVTSGPLMPSAQPSAIGGSTPANQQQLMSPTANHFANSLPVQSLSVEPSRAMSPANVAVGPSSRAGTTLPEYPSIAQTPSPTSTDSSLATRASASQVSPDGQTVNNPYFQAKPSPAAIASSGPNANSSAVYSQSTPQLSSQGSGPQDVAAQRPAVPTAANQIPIAQSPIAHPQPPATQFMQAQARVPANEQDPVKAPIPAQSVSFQPRSNQAASSTPENIQPALGGFCPFTLAKQGQWIRGDQKLAVKHRGRVYYLSSSEAVTGFMGNPDAYCPLLSGYDPMRFLASGELVDGVVQCGLHEQVSGTVLLFESEASKRQFEQDFDRNLRAIQTLVNQANKAR